MSSIQSKLAAVIREVKSPHTKDRQPFGMTPTRSRRLEQSTAAGTAQVAPSREVNAITAAQPALRVQPRKTRLQLQAAFSCTHTHRTHAWRHQSTVTILSNHSIRRMHTVNSTAQSGHRSIVGTPSILTRQHHMRGTVRWTVLEDSSRITSANAEVTPRGAPRGSSSTAEPSSTMRIAPAGNWQAHERRESRSAASTTATASCA